MTVRLRPHHLLCMLTFSGEGYTPAFVDNFAGVIRRLNDGEPIEVVDGIDDICPPLLSEAFPHCHEYGVTLRDRDAREDLAAVLGQPVQTLRDLPDLATLRRAFAAGDTRRGCQGCEWFGLCSDIAVTGFRTAHLGRTS